MSNREHSKIMIVVIDSASLDGARRLSAQLQQRQLDIEWLAYNHSPSLLRSMKSHASALNIPIHTPVVMRPVAAKLWGKRMLRRPFQAGFRNFIVSGVLLAGLVGIHLFARLGQKMGLKDYSKGMREGLAGVCELTFGEFKDRHRIKRLLCNTRPSIVVFHHDYAGHATGIVRKVAHQLNMLTVLRPALAPTPDTLAELLSGKVYNKAEDLGSRWVKHLFPSWTRKGKGGIVLRYAWQRIVALKLAGHADGDPWVHQKRAFDVVSLPNLKLIELYKSFGFPERKISLHPEHLSNVSTDSADSSGRPSIMVAVPPNQFTSDYHNSPYDTYEDMLDHLHEMLKTLSADFHIELALHPKSRGQQEALVQSWDFPIISGPSYEALPRFDVLFSHIASSTVHWPADLGKGLFVWNPFGHDVPEDLVCVDSQATLLKAAHVALAEKQTQAQASDNLQNFPDYLIDTLTKRRK